MNRTHPGEHRALNVVAAIILAFILLAFFGGSCSAAHGQRTPVEQHYVAIDTVAVRQLAEFWDAKPDSAYLACLYLHREAEGALIIDSAPLLRRDCARFGGAVGFVYVPLDSTEISELFGALVAVLQVVRQWQFVGTVYGVTIARTPSGRWIRAPRIVWAFRR